MPSLSEAGEPVTADHVVQHLVVGDHVVRGRARCRAGVVSVDQGVNADAGIGTVVLGPVVHDLVVARRLYADALAVPGVDAARLATDVADGGDSGDGVAGAALDDHAG